VPWSVFTGARTPGERWTEQDTLLAAALVEYEAGLCSGCGHPLDESTPEKHRYESPPPRRCQACTVIGRRRDEYDSRDDVKHKHALHYGSRRLPD
jgi:hypothetical protein